MHDPALAFSETLPPEARVALGDADTRALTTAPTLRTGRLTLRGPVREDLAPFTAWITAFDRMAVFGGNGSVDAAWRGFMAGIGHWHWHGYGFFMITDTTTGEVLGRCGLLRHHGWPETELAWHLFDGAEGRGVAFEAAVAVRHWAGETLGLPPLASFITPDNARSLSLANRLHATAESEGAVDGDTVVIHRHLPFDAAPALAQHEEAGA
ncbi:GNAT family N-acetyltransferase [Loktanella fryxellensis]|nr:GNAT family N-acetyltransferase [Loktanella fryxellensis]